MAHDHGGGHAHSHAHGPSRETERSALKTALVLIVSFMVCEVVVGVLSGSLALLSDAAHMIFEKKARDFTGKFLIDDTFLAENGVTDFDQYRVDSTVDLMPDFFVPDWIPPPKGVSLKAKG